MLSTIARHSPKQSCQIVGKLRYGTPTNPQHPTTTSESKSIGSILFSDKQISSYMQTCVGSLAVVSGGGLLVDLYSLGLTNSVFIIYNSIAVMFVALYLIECYRTIKNYNKTVTSPYIIAGGSALAVMAGGLSVAIMIGSIGSVELLIFSGCALQFGFFSASYKVLKNVNEVSN